MQLDPTPPVVGRPWKLVGCLGAVGFVILLVAVGALLENFTEGGRQRVAERDARHRADSLATVARHEAEEEEERQERAEREAEDRQTEAKVMCEGFVKDRLVSPATADFPWTDYTASCTGTRCTVSSYVDSQNRFGAMLRTTYRCLVEETGPDRWTLLELETR